MANLLRRPDATLLLFLAFGACLPAFDNPFDPETPSGDGLLRIVEARQVGDATVRIKWQGVTHASVTGFRLARTNTDATAGGEPAPASFTVAANVFEYLDTSATAGGTYTYRVSALAGEAESEAGPSATVSVTGVEPIRLLVERTGIGAVTIRWEELPEWAVMVRLTRDCLEGACTSTDLPEVAATAMQSFDDLDEGSVVRWAARFTNADGVALDASLGETESLAMVRRGPQAIIARRHIASPTVIEVPFESDPDAAAYEGLAWEAIDDAGTPAATLVATGTAEGNLVRFDGLDPTKGYVVAIISIGPNEKRTLPGESRFAPTIGWRRFQADRATGAPPAGDLPWIAWRNAGSGTVDDRFELLAATGIDQASSTPRLDIASTAAAVPGGFRAHAPIELSEMSLPIVPHSDGTRFRWVSLSTGAALEVGDSGTSETTVGRSGFGPSAGFTGIATAIDPVDGSVWVHGGTDGASPDATMRRGTFIDAGETITWETLAVPGAIDGRARHAIAVHEGALYFIGGVGSVGPPGPRRYFARWLPGEPAADLLHSSFEGGPDALLDLALVSQGGKLWAAGGNSALGDPPPSVWTWDPIAGWDDIGTAAKGPRPKGGRWSVVPGEMGEGPGLTVYDGSRVFRFEPLPEQAGYRWVAVDAPPAERALRGVFDIHGSTYYIAGTADLWRFESGDFRGWSKLASAGVGEWPEGALGFDVQQPHVLAYGGGDSVFALDPGAPSPSWSTLLTKEGGPAGLRVDQVVVGESLSGSGRRTLFAMGHQTGDDTPVPGPAVWSVPLDGTSSWRRHDGGATPFAPDSQCATAPKTCWDPGGPVVYAVGFVSPDPGEYDLALYAVRLFDSTPQWQPIATQQADEGCARVEAIVCSVNEPAIYAYGSAGPDPRVWRFDPNAGLVTLVENPPGLPGPGLRTRPALLLDFSNDRLFLFGGRDPAGAHDVWTLRFR